MTVKVVVIMDIIMLSAANRDFKGVRPRSLFHSTWYVILTTVLSCHAFGQSDLDVTASATSSAIYQDVQAEENGIRSLTTFTVTPQINAAYQSRTFNGMWSGMLTHLERENNTNEEKDTFEEYRYTSNWQAIDKYLVIQASGALNYQNTSSGNYLLSDFVTNSEALSKTRSNQILGVLSLNNGNWLRAQGTASYSDVESNSTSTDSVSALNNDTYSLAGTLTSGETAKRFIWLISGNYQLTQRPESAQGEFISRAGEFVLDTMLLRNWALRTTASHEGNQLSDRTDTFSSTRQFNSYGIGLTYRQDASRYIALTANRSSSDIEEEQETFVGVDMAWALSTRSALSGSYGRRFYGESADAKFSYNTKYFRSSFSYSEEVTNTSRLLANPENLGVFVCPVDSTSIADCFQPNSLSYDTDANEELLQITTQNLEYDDNIILRKSSNTQLGYQFSRITLGLAWQYAEDNYLDDNRLRRTYSGSTSLAYKLGSYTNLTTSIQYANIEDRGSDSASGESENWNGTLGVTRTFGENLTTSISMTYIDKRGDLDTGGFFGANYKDRRITLSASYKYE